MVRKRKALIPTVERPKGTRFDYAEHEDIMEEDLVSGIYLKYIQSKQNKFMTKTGEE